MTAEAKMTPGNDEADERELHLSSIVAGRHSCSCSSFALTLMEGVHHCQIFSFEVNIERAMTAEAKMTPGNDEADERELHLSSIVAGRHSCSCIQLLLV
ncbi:hypothetical protein CDAR_305911 [Caerostris darwini]|uniref:Uncharacterized protein n=1 Tax=Caerostris darwini TaxID=1538125 RepID=A0AAV4VSX3_9ARAC|nr:hypothetical protein CDAR_305911 [Caerostris darwini]